MDETQTDRDQPPMLEPNFIAPVRSIRRSTIRSRDRPAARRTPRSLVGCSFGVGASCWCVLFSSRSIVLPVHQGRRHLGHQHPGRVGLRHHQLRVVDRHRPRRHADLGHSAAAQPAVAHLDQPLCRGHDAVRRGLRRAVPAPASGPSVVFYWLSPIPTPCGMWPQFRSPLVWDVFAVSTYADGLAVFWYVGLMPDLATLRDRAKQPVSKRALRHPGAGLARLGAALAALRKRVSAAGRTGDAAGALGPHASSASTSPSPSCPAGTRRSSRRTSWRARSFPGLRWC